MRALREVDWQLRAQAGRQPTAAIAQFRHLRKARITLHLRFRFVVGKLLRREITYLSWLRANYKKPLNIDDLADFAGMGRSTLHHHFRTLTAMSPLQFQKQLRLHAARQRMLVDAVDAASAAFEVGYESASQFNREYRRFFGKPPIRDIQALRIAEWL
jgi:AraC-like DNA-binding protein